MENYEKTLNPQEPRVQQTHPAIPPHPIQQQPQHIQNYAIPQQHMQHYGMHQMPRAPMQMHQMQHMQMPSPLGHPHIPPVQVPLSIIQPQVQTQKLPSISTFPSISPVAQESFKRKSESPFKKINFPAAKIKAIMKADDEVAMISSDAVLAMAAATELFLQELADASWKNTTRDSRKTILYKDVAKAVESSIEFEFLNDVSQTY